jgi:hypothetical protein
VLDNELFVHGEARLVEALVLREILHELLRECLRAVN